MPVHSRPGALVGFAISISGRGRGPLRVPPCPLLPRPGLPPQLRLASHPPPAGPFHGRFRAPRRRATPLPRVAPGASAPSRSAASPAATLSAAHSYHCTGQPGCLFYAHLGYIILLGWRGGLSPPCPGIRGRSGRTVADCHRHHKVRPPNDPSPPPTSRPKIRSG